MKYYFPVHINGGNRGCEGIAKGTALILDEPKDRLLGLCTDVVIDRQLGIDQYITLQQPRIPSLSFKISNRIFVQLKKMQHCDEYEQSDYSRKYVYGNFVEQMTPDDCLLSTGGDMMCYNDNFAIYTALEAKLRGCKTVLWGCSMGPQNLTPRKEEALRSFDLIYARETLSRDFFLSLGLKHVICYPDPAFALEPVPTELPNCFTKGRVIGVNLSNFTVGAFNLNTPFGEEVSNLLDYLINKTDYQILLIPHVTWNGQDDRLLAQAVKDEYKEVSNGRVDVLNINNLSYLQIRYIISKCHIFIGGRTHAIISAYSTCTPAIALGYSIKSKGIAHDLGISEKYVVDTKSKILSGQLVDVFKDADKEQAEIRSHLKRVIPGYSEQTNRIKKHLL